jgi:hypothetical protein
VVLVDAVSEQTSSVAGVRTMLWRMVVGMAVMAFAASLGTACQPVDADPSHVTLSPGPCGAGTATWCLHNGTSYAVRIDGQDFTPAPTTPTVFSPSTVLAGHGAEATSTYDPTPCGSMSASVQFTLIGAKHPDGSPVTGEAKFGVVACPVS